MISTIPQPATQQRIWLYFLDTRLRYAVVVLFLGLALGEILLGKILLLFGLLWLAGALLFNRARPSDQEIEDLLSRDVESLVEKALQSLNPRDEEMPAEPLVLRGPIELNAPAFRKFLTRPRTGKDGGRRSPVNRAVILLPLEDRLGIYSCHRDSLNDQTSQISVEEHHYRDVVSLTLEKDAEAARDRTGRTGQILSLELKSSRRLSIPVSDAQPSETAAGDGLPGTGMAKTVRAIQALMRDKR